MKNLFPDTSGLSPSQLKIADFIERNPEEMLFMTEQEIADRLGTSIATVSRFWRAVGHENAKAFKLKLRESSDTTPAIKLEKRYPGWTRPVCPRKCWNRRSIICKTRWRRTARTSWRRQPV